MTKMQTTTWMTLHRFLLHLILLTYLGPGDWRRKKTPDQWSDHVYLLTNSSLYQQLVTIMKFSPSVPGGRMLRKGDRWGWNNLVLFICFCSHLHTLFSCLCACPPVLRVMSCQTCQWNFISHKPLGGQSKIHKPKYKICSTVRWVIG